MSLLLSAHKIHQSHCLNAESATLTDGIDEDVHEAIHLHLERMRLSIFGDCLLSFDLGAIIDEQCRPARNQRIEVLATEARTAHMKVASGVAASVPASEELRIADRNFDESIVSLVSHQSPSGSRTVGLRIFSRIVF